MKNYDRMFRGESNHIWLKIRRRRLHAPYLKLIAGTADSTKAMAIMAESAWLFSTNPATTSAHTHPLQSPIIPFTESMSVHVENAPVRFSDHHGRRS